MVAFLIYNDGIMMAMDFAAIIGAVLYGMNQQQLIVLMILVQVTSVIGAYTAGLFSDRIGFKRALMACLVLMLAAVIWMLFNQTLAGYFIIASLAGFALTGVQVVSRTMTGIFAPKGQSAEFYSFESVAGRKLGNSAAPRQTRDSFPDHTQWRPTPSSWSVWIYRGLPVPI